MSGDDDPQLVKKRFARGCMNRDVRDAVSKAIDAGARPRLTKKGVLLFGPNGDSTAAHYTASDRHAYKNLLAQLKKMGFNL